MMRSYVVALAAGTSVLLALPAPAVAQASYADKVSITVPPNTTRNPPTCFYFRLHNVEIDFAVPQSDLAYSEMFATVMLAASSGRVLYVGTTGTVACGMQQVQYVYISWPP